MAYSNATVSGGDAGSGPPNATFRAAVGLYAGALLAGLVTTATALSVGSSAPLGGIAVAAFPIGAAAGVGLAGRLRALPSRLGRTWRRKLVILCGALPFAAVIAASVLGPLAPAVGLAALGSAVAVAISGLVLAQAAENGYADAVTDGDEPIASWRWHWSPTGSRKLDLVQFVLVVSGSLLAVDDALAGGWWTAIVWIGVVLTITAASIAEGRWTRWLPSGQTEAAVRVYEHGFATERPFRRQFVPWSSISRVRLRDDELVVDRSGLFDHRFDRDDLEDPEALREAIDRRRSAPGDGRP